jgi:glycosyltransferase involved in cell wall biosynthesis
MENDTYALITPARNEEALIEKTLKSVVGQSVRPKMWIIVSDGSTDRTDDIVMRYATAYNFIRLLRREPNSNRNYASRVYAMHTGVEQVKELEYDFIGCLDADVSFEPHYYESILARFRANPRLGIAGGTIWNKDNNGFREQSASRDHVAGAIQMFRRKCYEEIGGLTPSKVGGADTIAEITARMRGWQTRSFSDLRVLHYRQIGIRTRSPNVWHARIHAGIFQYSMGYHWLFVLVRSLYKIFERPYLLGSILTLCGFSLANLQRKERAVSNEVVKYLRREQLSKLSRIFGNDIRATNSKSNNDKFLYEEKYHLSRHEYLITNQKYYLLRARLALERYFDKDDIDKKALEFGVGLGQNIYFLRSRAGFDISEFARSFARKKGIDCYSTIEEIPNEHFDIVLCCHVLEHLDNPLQSLKVISQKLKARGKIILVIPKERHKKASFELDGNQHLYAWNFRTINNLLNRAGFEVVENAAYPGRGYFKLMPLASITYRLWRLATSIVGRAVLSWELKIVALKRPECEEGESR